MVRHDVEEMPVINESLAALSPERMQQFAFTLAGLSREEVRQAKVLYVKNAIADYRTARSSMAAFGCFQIPFMIMPLFWPFLYFQRRAVRLSMENARQKIANAIEVWSDDLAGSSISLEDLD